MDSLIPVKTIIVLGMHRSGTSAITGAIGQLGAATGPKPRIRKLWENIPLRKFNDRLLTLGGGSWDAPPPVGWLTQPSVRSLVPEARDVVAAQFEHAPVAVWKDPRTCLTMPFWLEVLDEEPVFLVIYRHPGEVADSLAARNSFTPAHSHAIWERYNADALRSAEGRPTVVLEYGKVVAGPVESLEIIITAFAEAGVALPNDPATTEHGLVAQARHHTSETPDALSDVATAAQRDLFDLLRQVEGAHKSLQLPATVPPQEASSVQVLTLAAQRRQVKRARKERKGARKAAAAKLATAGAAPASPAPLASERVERRNARRQAADAADAGGADLRARIGFELAAFLDRRVQRLIGLGDGLADLVAALDGYINGGKLLRPTFCYWGWRAAGGDDDDPRIIGAAGALELLHASALVHDDVMDASSTRRGRPTAHRGFAEVHRSRDWHGSADAFGAAAAILLGDLCLGWSEEALRSCGLPPGDLAAGIAVYDLTRTEVIAGQYLDIAAQSARSSSVGAALDVVELKSARYTVQRPLQLGAALAGGSDELAAALARYGRPVGTAFQLRDDLLGAFGDPATTGKPVGDDLREGKRTVLLAHGYELADPVGVATLDRFVGDAELDGAGVAAIQRVLLDCGAEQRVEALIGLRARAGLEALESMPVSDPAAIDALAELTTAVTVRVV